MSKRDIKDDDLDFLNKQQRAHTASFGQNLAYGLTAIAASCIPHCTIARTKYLFSFNCCLEELKSRCNLIIFLKFAKIFDFDLAMASAHPSWYNSHK